MATLNKIFQKVLERESDTTLLLQNLLLPLLSAISFMFIDTNVDKNLSKCNGVHCKDLLKDYYFTNTETCSLDFITSQTLQHNYYRYVINFKIW